MRGHKSSAQQGMVRLNGPFKIVRLNRNFLLSFQVHVLREVVHNDGNDHGVVNRRFNMR